MMTKELTTTTTTTEITPMQLLQVAMDKGADLDKMEKLMEMQERWEDRQAKKAFVVAMAEFKANPPTIVKNNNVSYSGTDYNHASHDEVAIKIGKALHKVGISHRWKSSQENGMITVNCILTHIDGHSEEEPMTSAADTSGKKNPIQAMASAKHYMERYTLLSITGMSSGEKDTDGWVEEENISPEQLKILQQLVDTKKVNVEKLCTVLKIDSLPKLKIADFGKAHALLERKK
jgi:hypothetical protein